MTTVRTAAIDTPASTPHRTRRVLLCTLVAALSLGALAARAGATVVYDNLPATLPGNLPSEGFQYTQSSEFGGQVGLAGTQRVASWAEVALDSFGCQQGTYAGNCQTTPGATFSTPITLNLYSVGANNAVGSKLGSVTETFAIPYRPSASAMCAIPAQWYDAASGNCYNGLATPVTFDLSSLHLTLPDQVIVSVSLNTSDYGSAPYGHSTACYPTTAGCPYDLVQVGLIRTAPSIGSDPDTSDNYLYSLDSYCDHGAAGVNVFRLDAPAPGGTACWTNTAPAIELDAATTSTSVDVNVTGNTPPALSLSVAPNAAPSLGTFVPAVTATYTASLPVTATSTGGDSQLTIYDPSPTDTGHLVNGTHEMVQPLDADATDAADPTATFAPIGSTAAPELLLTKFGPYSNDAVTVNFQQMIAATDPMRTGIWSKTIILTLSTTTP
jgi:hypothetical protein